MTSRSRWLALTLPCAVFGLLLGPIMMEPVYGALAAPLGPAALLVVELTFAFLIDIPLAGVFVALRCALGPGPANPARSAVVFTLFFFALIGVCIALSPAHPVFAWLGLATTFRPAVAAALAAFGAGTVGVMLVCYLAFDLLSCAAAGIAAERLAARGGAPKGVRTADEGVRTA